MVYLELNDETNETVTRYRSKILDFEKGCIFIDFPVDDKKQKPVFFLQGTQFKVWFLGGNGAVYLFQTEVLGKTERKFPMLVLKDPGKAHYIRVQRREYVRVDSAVDTAVYPVHQSFAPFTAVTADLSGGGLALHLPAAHKILPEESVNIWLSLSYRTGDIQYVHSRAKLIRTKQDHGRTIGSFQFEQIKESDRQKVVRYCFERQLIVVKKEKMT